MSIRLNKAIRELNIGLQTAVEFLEKRSDLGEVRSDLSFKLSDQQYEALVEQFRKDKEVKGMAGKLFAKHQKEKKPEPKKTAPELAKTGSEPKQQFKPLGKIDLDSIGKKPAAKQPAAPAQQNEPKIVAPAAEAPQPKAKAEPKEVPAAAAPDVEPRKEPVMVKPKTEEAPKASEPKIKPQAVEAAQPNPEPQKTVALEPKPATADTTPVSAAEQQTSQPDEKLKKQKAPQGEVQENGVFTLKSEQKLAPKVNVLGKIDLSSINQNTRPKKKTKEEKRREREEKARQTNGGQSAGGGGEKKKRQRIGKERVDIEAEGRKTQSGNNGGGKNSGAANNANANAGKKKNKKRVQKPLEVNEEDVARQVKETLARLTNKQNQNKKGARYRKEKRDAVQERLHEQMAEEQAGSKVLKLTEFVTVSELATMMNVGVNQVIGTCMSIGIMVSINQRLDAETINIVAEEFGFTTEYVSAEVQNAITEEADDENDLVSRAPIVTVMGHVDHGKTSLLDHIRNTNVIAGEAGGITQHIGAYLVELKDGRKITFLDTPGHEAFTAMRARGAQVTDIAIIIIAADDSVMPTTKEAIAHAQAANVPMVFAINKIDKPGANPDKIREDLANMNLLVEEWGGKYQSQEISAKKGIGVDELLEKVLLEAEMLDLKANPNRKATGSIIESSLDKGRGYVSTVLVSNGTLHVGDIVVAGTSYGRIKAMFNERNQRIEKAGPAEPAIILGLNGAPTAGDSFHIMETEQEAREITGKRVQLQREQSLRTTKKFGLDELSHRIALGEFHELNIIVKGDTDGSIEALSDSFIKLSTEKVQVNVIAKAVGQISENDVMLASASDAIIVGFQVRPSADARKAADREGVEINTYSIIYDAIDDIKSTMVGMLDKVIKEQVTGQVEVKQVFKISKVGTVAGGLVTEGKVHNKDKARVVRDGIVIHTAPIDALKRYKDDVKEVASGFECGLSLVNFNDIQEGDIIETFTEIEIEQKL